MIDATIQLVVSYKTARSIPVVYSSSRQKPSALPFVCNSLCYLSLKNLFRKCRSPVSLRAAQELKVLLATADWGHFSQWPRVRFDEFEEAGSPDLNYKSQDYSKPIFFAGGCTNRSDFCVFENSLNDSKRAFKLCLRFVSTAACFREPFRGNGGNWSACKRQQTDYAQADGFAAQQVERRVCETTARRAHVLPCASRPHVLAASVQDPTGRVSRIGAKVDRKNQANEAAPDIPVLRNWCFQVKLQNRKFFF